MAEIFEVNKRGGWQKHSNYKFHWNKINKWSCENINKKNIRNTKVVYLHEESLVLLLDSPLQTTSFFIVIRKQFRAMWKKQSPRYHCRLCTWINKWGVWNKRGGWQNSPKLINGECWIGFVLFNSFFFQKQTLRW